MSKLQIWGKRPGLFVNNIRFYILLFTLCVSVFVAAFLRLQIEQDMLYRIRLQQVYGFMALGYWYFALLATPMSTIFGKMTWVKNYQFARRALGVSAAYCALLHAGISLFGQLGGISSIGQLPMRFQVALWFGLVGVVTLFLMAVTSFDKVIAFLTFPRWKWLHRVGYAAAILVYLHVWMIGTHIGNPAARTVIFCLLAVFVLAESWRVSVVIDKISAESDKLFRVLVCATFSILIISLMFLTPRIIKSYHDHGSHSAGNHR